MLRLEQDQMNQLKMSFLHNFSKKIAKHLSEKYPMRSEFHDEQFIHNVHTHTLKAKTFGFSTEQHIAFYVVSAQLFPDDFIENKAQIEQIMSNGSIDVNDRYDELVVFVEKRFNATAAE